MHTVRHAGELNRKETASSTFLFYSRQIYDETKVHNAIHSYITPQFPW